MILVSKQRVCKECLNLINYGFSLFDHFFLMVLCKDVATKISLHPNQWLAYQKYSLEKTEGVIKKGKFRETSKTGLTERRKTKQKYNTIIRWKPPHVSKHKQRRQDMSPPTNKWRQRRITHSFHRLFGLSDMYNLYICFAFNL